MNASERWLIRYADGTKFSNLDGTPLDAPKDGVLWVAWGNKPHTEHGLSYYCYDTEQQQWYMCDFNGREARLRTRPTKTVCFQGEQVPDDDWKRIQEEMKNPW